MDSKIQDSDKGADKKEFSNELKEYLNKIVAEALIGKENEDILPSVKLTSILNSASNKNSSFPEPVLFVNNPSHNLTPVLSTPKKKVKKSTKNTKTSKQSTTSTIIKVEQKATLKKLKSSKNTSESAPCKKKLKPPLPKFHVTVRDKPAVDNSNILTETDIDPDYLVKKSMYAWYHGLVDQSDISNWTNIYKDMDASKLTCSSSYDIQNDEDAKLKERWINKVVASNPNFKKDLILKKFGKK